MHMTTSAGEFYILEESFVDFLQARQGICRGAEYLVKLRQVTHKWQPVSSDSHLVSVGAVHKGKLYIPQINGEGGGTDFVTHDLNKRECDFLSCRVLRAAPSCPWQWPISAVLIPYGRKLLETCMSALPCPA